MNILIPMAGLGSRFSVEGYEKPKPLIEFLGKPMIQHAVDTLGIEGNYIFCVHEDHCRDYSIDKKLKDLYPDCNIVSVDYITDGSATTCMLAREFIDNDEELISTNCDQYMRWDGSAFRHWLNETDADGALVTFYSDSQSNSYARVGADGYVDLVREKEVISQYSSNGIHYWRKGRYFCESYDRMVEANDRTNNEFYVAPTYNYMISNGLKVKVYNIDREEHCSTGTPLDLEKLIKQMKKESQA
jgi:NDP-sugar pyrophosphorylase family protein